MPKNGREGEETGPSPDLILEFGELLAEARDHLKELQSSTARTTYRLVKFADALQTWMELNDINADRQLPLTRKSVPQVVERAGRQSGDNQLRDLASRSKPTASKKATP